MFRILPSRLSRVRRRATALSVDAARSINWKNARCELDLTISLRRFSIRLNAERKREVSSFMGTTFVVDANTSLLTLDLRDLAKQEAHLVAVKARNLRDPVDVPHQIALRAEERREGGLPLAPAKQRTVRGNGHLHEPRRRAVLSEETAADRGELAAHLDRAEFGRAVASDLFGFADRLIGHRATEDSSLEWSGASRSRRNPPTEKIRSPRR